MGFFERLTNAWKIFKLTFALMGKDKSLVIAPVIMVLGLFVVILLILPLFGISLLAVSVLEMKSYYPYLFLLLFAFIFYFWTTFWAAVQSWMVHEVLQGKDTTLASGFARALRNFFDILAFCIVMAIANLLLSKLKGKGRAGAITGGFLETLVGIAGQLVIPAMIVTKRNFKDSVKQLKESVRALPEIATYEIGTVPIVMLFMLLIVASGLLTFFLYGVNAALFVGVLLLCTAMVILSYVNITYYTIVYLSLIEKKRIPGLKITGI